MSYPTGDPRITAQMNDLLGRELGRNEYGEPYFSWRWSEDCFWPAFATGKKNLVETKVELPIIGGGTETSIMQSSDPEYKRDRQLRKRDLWYICKWLSPWELILGPKNQEWLKHGDQRDLNRAPSTDALIAAWNRQNPGADFPSRGWRIPTDAYLPTPGDENWDRSPHRLTTPNPKDTEHFIRQVKFQTSRPGDEVLQDMLDCEDASDKRVEVLIGEECANAFPALLNPNPGARSSFVSMPWSKRDRMR